MDEYMFCGFCGKHVDFVEYLIESVPVHRKKEHGSVYICNGCVELAHNVLQEKRAKQKVMDQEIVKESRQKPEDERELPNYPDGWTDYWKR